MSEYSKPKEEQASEVGGVSRMVDPGKEALRTGVGRKTGKRYSSYG